jgi:hypothetical protein
MTDLLCANVVSDAYFESPGALADDMHLRGDRLGARMLWSARPDDVTLLSAAPSSAFLDVVARVLGFMPRIVVVSRSGKQTLPEAALACPHTMRDLRGMRIRAVLPYAASLDVYRLGAALGAGIRGPSPAFARSQRVRSVNSKRAFRRLAPILGFPVAPGYIPQLQEPIAPTTRGFIVKERLSGGGLGNRLVSHPRELAAAISGGPVVVERFEDMCSWPSVDFVITPQRRVEFRQLSMMRITDHAYDGIVIPAREAAPGLLTDLVRYGRAIGQWWARRGYVGWYDVDGGITKDGRLILTEMNARCTGGTPVDAVARTLLGPDYPSRGYLLSREHLQLSAAPDSVFRLAAADGLLVSREKPYGVIPMWESPEESALGYLVVGATRKQVRELECRWLDITGPGHGPAIAGGSKLPASAPV